MSEQTYNDPILSDYDRGYCEKVAEHLAKHYDQGVWDMGGMSGMSSKDFEALEETYNKTVFNAKKKYQKQLNRHVIEYFSLVRIIRGRHRVPFKTVKEIVHYKLVVRPKTAFRKWLCK